jgi:hypothetical protein
MDSFFIMLHAFIHSSSWVSRLVAKGIDWFKNFKYNVLAVLAR